MIGPVIPAKLTKQEQTFSYVSSLKNARLKEKYGPIWRDHITANRPMIKMDTNSVISRRHFFRPTILCGAGPGLDLAIKELHEIKREAVEGRHDIQVACVDMAYRPLMMAKPKIKPDFIITLDHHPEAVPAMLDVKTMKPPPCFFSVTSPPEAVKRWKGSRHFYMVAGTEDLARDIVPGCTALPTIPGFGTVSGTAMLLAQSFYAPMIAFVGNDLSFPMGDDGHYHSYCKNTIRANQANGTCIIPPKAVKAVGYDDDEDPPFYKSNIVDVDDKTGKLVRTTRVLRDSLMDYYCHNFASFLNQNPEAGSDGIEYYNCTRGMLDVVASQTMMKKSTLRQFADRSAFLYTEHKKRERHLFDRTVGESRQRKGLVHDLIEAGRHG